MREREREWEKRERKWEHKRDKIRSVRVYVSVRTNRFKLWNCACVCERERKKERESERDRDSVCVIILQSRRCYETQGRTWNIHKAPIFLQDFFQPTKIDLGKEVEVKKRWRRPIGKFLASCKSPSIGFRRSSHFVSKRTNPFFSFFFFQTSSSFEKD